MMAAKIVRTRCGEAVGFGLKNLSMVGLDPTTQPSERLIEIIPVGVELFDQLQLPLAKPPLE